MGILAIRDSAAASSESSTNNVGKNVGIVLGCLAALVILLPIISRSCNCFGGAHNQEQVPAPATATSRRRHLNAAEIMRLCALRDNARPPPEKPVKKSLLNASEVELAAPKISWARLVAREQRQSTITVPPKALIRDQEASQASEEASTCSMKMGAATTVSVDEPEDQAPVCSICLEGYDDDDAVRETVCHHVFHSFCLEQWLMKRRSHCPLCQGDLKVKREEC